MDASLPEFLASLGRTELHPGGSYAVKRLIRLLDLSNSDRVLLIGPYAKDTVALVQAETEVSDGVRQARGTDDIERLPYEDNHFDAVVIEAVLSLQRPQQQRATLDEVARVLKPGGKLGIHELCWRQPPTPERQAALEQAWQGYVRPGVARDWWDRLESAGFEDFRHGLSVVRYFTREGQEFAKGGNDEPAPLPDKTASPAARQRFADACREFTENRRYYGVIVARALRQPVAAVKSLPADSE